MQACDDFDFHSSLAESNFSYFSKNVLNLKFGWFHKEWVDIIENSDKNVDIIAPRGHFKSTILSIAYPLWMLYRTKRKGLVILNVSASMDQSVQRMQYIKDHISSNPILYEKLYIENRTDDDKWSSDEIDTLNGCKVRCVPFRHTARGSHSDLTISDDVLTEESTSGVSRDKAKELWYGVFYPTTQARKGRHVVVGTPLAYDDLLMDLSTKEDFEFRKYQAVLPSGAPLFPEHFSPEQLAKIKTTLPPHIWSREYMCEPISSDTAAISYEKHIIPSVAMYPSVELKDPLSYLGVDVALSGAAGADYFVLTHVDYVYKSPKKIRFIERYHGVNEDFIIKRITDLHSKHNYRAIAIEKIGSGFGITQSLQDKYGNILPVNYRKENQSRNDILSDLQMHFLDFNITIPQNTFLIDELQGLTVDRDGKYVVLKQHDDCVMSLALALYAIRARSSVYSLTYI